MSPSCSKALMWWKAKKASLCKVRSTRPSSFRTTKNFAPCSGFQAKVFDERLATHQQFERINQQGKLRQNYVVLRHAKAVQISRFGGGDGANDPPLELLVNKEDVVAGFTAVLHIQHTQPRSGVAADVQGLHCGFAGTDDQTILRVDADQYR